MLHDFQVPSDLKRRDGVVLRWNKDREGNRQQAKCFRVTPLSGSCHFSRGSRVKEEQSGHAIRKWSEQKQVHIHAQRGSIAAYVGQNPRINPMRLII